MVQSCDNFQDKTISNQNKQYFLDLPYGKERYANFLLKCYEQKLIKSQKNLDKFKKEQLAIKTNYDLYEKKRKEHIKKKI